MHLDTDIWTLSALEALRNALYKFKTYLLTYLLPESRCHWDVVVILAPLDISMLTYLMSTLWHALQYSYTFTLEYSMSRQLPTCGDWCAISSRVNLHRCLHPSSSLLSTTCILVSLISATVVHTVKMPISSCAQGRSDGGGAYIGIYTPKISNRFVHVWDISTFWNCNE